MVPPIVLLPYDRALKALEGFLWWLFSAQYAIKRDGSTQSSVGHLADRAYQESVHRVQNQDDATWRFGRHLLQPSWKLLH